MNARVLHADGTWRDDTWRVVRNADESHDVNERMLLPLALLGSNRGAARGVWLAPTDDPAVLARHLDTLPLIAVDFPTFTDGRGYSTAALLRRLGYRGQLRAIGDVLIDQLYFLKRVGFTSYALRADQDAALAVAALKTYSDAYQGAADQVLPAFRRRAREVTHAEAIP